jgi:hypothetical protein
VIVLGYVSTINALAFKYAFCASSTVLNCLLCLLKEAVIQHPRLPPLPLLPGIGFFIGLDFIKHSLHEISMMLWVALVKHPHTEHGLVGIGWFIPLVSN